MRFLSATTRALRSEQSLRRMSSGEEAEGREHSVRRVATVGMTNSPESVMSRPEIPVVKTTA